MVFCMASQRIQRGDLFSIASYSEEEPGGQLEFNSPSSAGDGQGQCPRTSPPQDGSDKATFFFFGFLSFFSGY